MNGVDIGESDNPNANSRSGELIILGGGKCVWDDYIKVTSVETNHDIMCINDMAVQFREEQVTHAVSLHRQWLPAVKLIRSFAAIFP